MGKNKSFIDEVSSIDVFGGRGSVPMPMQGVRKVGVSVDSYLTRGVQHTGLRRVTDSARVSDSSVHRMACQLYSQDRGTRRSTLAGVSPGTRRRLLEEGKRIRRMVTDSCIEYSPELCWAISSVIHENSDEAYALLRRKYRSLPAEVKEFYDAFVEDRYSNRAERAQRMLKEYRLVQDDDERVDEFFGSALEQEDRLDDAVDEAVTEGVELQEGAQAALDEVSSQIREKTSTFLDEVSQIYAGGVEEIIAAQVSEGAAETTEAILDEPVAEPDLEDVDDPLGADEGDDFGADGDGAYDVDEDVDVREDFREATDSAPRRRLGRRVVRDSRLRRVVRDSRRVADKREALKKEETLRERLARLRDSEDAPFGAAVEVFEEQPLPPVPEGEGMPMVPFAVGTQVQITYNGNLYNGTISAAGNGAVVVEGLPFEYFSARQEAGAFSGTAEDFTFAEEDVVALPAMGPEGEPLEVVEAADVVIEEPIEGGDADMDGDATPEGAEGDADEDDDAPADSAPAGKVSGKVSDAAEYDEAALLSALQDWYSSNIEDLRACTIVMQEGGDEFDDPESCVEIKEGIFDELLRLLESFFGDEHVEYVVDGEFGEFLLDGFTLLEVKPTKMVDGGGRAWSLTFGGSVGSRTPELFAVGMVNLIGGILAESKVSDAMDPNEDKDERININWSTERLMQELKARRAGRGKKEVADAVGSISKFAELSEKYDLPVDFFENLFDERQSFVIDPKLKEASSREELFQHIDEWADSEGIDDSLKQFIVDVKTAARFGFALSGLKKGNDYLLSFLGSTHAIQNGKRKDCYFATFGNVNTGKPIVLIANAIASEADLDYVKPEIIADAIFDCLDYGAEPAVVVDLDSFGGLRNYFLKIIEDGKFTKAQKAMLKNNLLSSLRGAVNDSTDSDAVIDTLIERARSGEDLADETGDIAFFFDEDGDVFVAVSGVETHSLVESDVRGYLQEHIDIFGPLVGDVKVTDATPEEEAVEAAVAEAAVDADVAAAEVAAEASVGAVVRQWVEDYCFRLGQNPVADVLQDATVALSDALGAAGFDSRVELSVPRVLLNGQRFIDVKANGIYVGTSLFMYQTADDAILATADTVADAAEQMFVSIQRFPISGSTVASDVDDNLRESMEDVVQDAADEDLLSDTAKRDIVHAAEKKVKDLLEEQGIEISDSDVDTLESFRAKRNPAEVLDSVLSKASEVIGSRVSPSTYRSLQGSSSKAAKAKLQKIADAAVSLDALDVICPVLYKEKVTDSFWVADSIKELAGSFGAVLPDNVDGRCVVSATPIPSELTEGRHKFTLSAGSTYLEVLV